MTQVESEAGRRLASMRRVHKKVCPVCGSEFEGIARRVYDRPACQVKAYRQRKKTAFRRHTEQQ
jgi:tRNA(Ile2) C34 agmatinyltransferase TiaS